MVKKITKEESEKLEATRKETVYSSPEYKDLSVLLENQRKISGSLSENVSVLESDKASFRKTLDFIAHAISPGYLEDHNMGQMIDAVRELVLDREYRKGAAEMAIKLHDQVVDKLVETVEKPHLQNSVRGIIKPYGN